MALVLGIESSCDESAAAIVDSAAPDLARRIVAQHIASQDEAHRPYGGVVPEIAARAHVEKLAPLIAVNHLEGHALSPRLVDTELRFPYLLLLVSGGHCQLLEVAGVGCYRRLATTIDDAVGEAFDKAAKLLGLDYPGGPALEALAEQGAAAAVALPRPLLGSADPHFSFAGLKSAVQRAVASGRHRPADVAASFQQAVVDCLVDRTARALKSSDAPALVVAGGVAANRAIRAALQVLAARNGRKFTVPPGWLCTDNAAMIAWAGAERLAAGLTDALDVPARARWPLDDHAEAVRGAGVKA